MAYYTRILVAVDLSEESDLVARAYADLLRSKIP